jgi:hypothetical protein
MIHKPLRATITCVRIESRGVSSMVWIVAARVRVACGPVLEGFLASDVFLHGGGGSARVGAHDAHALRGLLCPQGIGDGL